MKRKKFLSSIVYLLLFSSLFVGRVANADEISKRMYPHGSIKYDYKQANVELTEAFNPNQIKHAYGIDKIENEGEGQNIAVIVAYGNPNIKSDLDIFNKKYNLEPSKLNILYPNGKPDDSTITRGWKLETSIDVEWIHALAPKATITLVVAKSDSTEDLMSAVDYASKLDVSIINMSWGDDEFQDQLKYDSHFKNKDITYVASTGDKGAGGHWPATAPNVLAVGGTFLTLNSNDGLIESEIAWSRSGGGISKYEAQPEYQKKYGIQSNNYRTIPDVSFCASSNVGVSAYLDGFGWVYIQGTSFSAPAWSAFLALINEKRSEPLGDVHDKIYQLAKSPTYYCAFRDIVSGRNGPDSSNIAHEGYDFVTGLGSPSALNLYWNLRDLAYYEKAS